MTFPADAEARARYLRTVVARFAPVAMANLSQEWDAEVAGLPEWLAFRATVDRLADPSAVIGPEGVEEFTQVLTDLLDLWDEEPMGNTYYPFKAVELIQLHARMVTGDLRDDAPVPLAEWIGRFAGHVDWQIAESGVDMVAPGYFKEREIEFRSDREVLADGRGADLRDLLEKSDGAAAVYVAALRSALH